MKADRLLSILLLLQAHGRMTGRELAERLEVSGRTIHRDMDALSAAGVPVYALRGSSGGWRLDEGWQTSVPGLDEAELRALLMAQPRVIGDVRLAAAAERAIGKLMAAMPLALREQATAIRERLHVDTTSWYAMAERLEMLPVVQEAVWHDRKLAIRYASERGETTERTVDPLGLVAKGATWYLFANTDAGRRTFRVSRIEAATVLDDACERPARFDLAAEWLAATERFQEERGHFTAILRFEPEAARRFARWRLSTAVDAPPGPDGRITVEAVFDTEEQALFAVMGFGARVDVVEPASLRERALSETRAALARRRSPKSNSRG
jgi:predicted DNA-binding transcriptional regulator YafY